VLAIIVVKALFDIGRSKYIERAGRNPPARQDHVRDRSTASVEIRTPCTLRHYLLAQVCL
jgi:hypothetical protein